MICPDTHRSTVAASGHFVSGAEPEKECTGAVYRAGDAPLTQIRGRERMREERERSSNGEESLVLCGANSYHRKYYLNPEFTRLPEQIRQELQILCVTITEEAGGILTLEFEPDGSLHFKVRAEEGDYLFDDIASGMKISRARFEHQELLEELELYYRVVFLGESPE